MSFRIPDGRHPDMPHQVKGREYIKRTHHPSLLWEMRLGKTLTAIRGISDWAKDEDIKNVLIAAPINAMSSWERDLRMEKEYFVRAYACPKAQRIEAIVRGYQHPERVYCLINYEGFRALPRVAEMKWDVVLADESPKLKNPHAQVSDTFVGSFRDAKHRMILSGMVAPESELDLYQQFKFLHGSFMGCQSYWEFRNRYFEVDARGYSWIPQQGMRGEIKRLLHEKAFCLRRAQVGMNKRKIYSRRKVQMKPSVAKVYKQLEKEFAYELPGAYLTGTKMDETIWATGKALWLRRLAGGFDPKGEQCLDTAIPDDILYLLKSDLLGEKVVIYYAFIAELQHDLEYFTSKGIRCSAMMGTENMSMKDRDQNEWAFIYGKSQVLLCMERLVAQGKDFAISSTAIYRSNEYSCDLRSQSEDRILNVLKPGPLLYIDYVTEDTINEEGLEVIMQKVFNARELMTKFQDRRDGIPALFTF